MCVYCTYDTVAGNGATPDTSCASRGVSVHCARRLFFPRPSERIPAGRRSETRATRPPVAVGDGHGGPRGRLVPWRTTTFTGLEAVRSLPRAIPGNRVLNTSFVVSHVVSSSSGGDVVRRRIDAITRRMEGASVTTGREKTTSDASPSDIVTTSRIRVALPRHVISFVDVSVLLRFTVTRHGDGRAGALVCIVIIRPVRLFFRRGGGSEQEEVGRCLENFVFPLHCSSRD